MCFAESATDAAEEMDKATRQVANLEKRLKVAEVREDQAIGRLSAASTTLTGMQFCDCIRYLKLLYYASEHGIYMLC